MFRRLAQQHCGFDAAFVEGLRHELSVSDRDAKADSTDALEVRFVAEEGTDITSSRCCAKAWAPV
jgi:hypothetical protein